MRGFNAGRAGARKRWGLWAGEGGGLPPEVQPVDGGFTDGGLDPSDQEPLPWWASFWRYQGL